LIDLFSGAVGGVIVFVLTVLWAVIRDGRQQVRACVGYARLLNTEINANERVLTGTPPPVVIPEMVQEPYFRSFRNEPMGFGGVLRDCKEALSSEAWREVREPLAPLIAVADFERLDRRYRELDWFLVVAQPFATENPEEIAQLSSNPPKLLKKEVSRLLNDVSRLHDVLDKYTYPPFYTRVFGIRRLPFELRDPPR
jgi:hypothetical protein